MPQIECFIQHGVSQAEAQGLLCMHANMIECTSQRSFLFHPSSCHCIASIVITACGPRPVESQAGMSGLARQYEYMIFNDFGQTPCDAGVQP